MRKLLPLAVLLAGCAHQITAYGPQPVMTYPPYLRAVSIEVIWHPDVDAVNAACRTPHGRFYYACAELNPSTNWCTIHSTKPKDFNDDAVLKILGHELFHCLGAGHN